MDDIRMLTLTSGPAVARAQDARLLMTGAAALRVPVSGAKGTTLPSAGGLIVGRPVVASTVPFGHVRASEPDS